MISIIDYKWLKPNSWFIIILNYLIYYKKQTKTEIKVIVTTSVGTFSIIYI